MTPNMASAALDSPPAPPDIAKETLTDHQANETDPKKQAEYLRAYAEQLRRRATRLRRRGAPVLARQARRRCVD